MKITVIVPTYWTSNSPTVQRKMPDAVYDHPTPLESQSTLPRLLDSLKDTDMPNQSTTIFILVATTHRTLEKKAEDATREIMIDYEDDFSIKQFSQLTLKKMSSTDGNLAQLLSLYGYSNIRNTGLAIAQILKSDIVTFLDDDTLVNDRKYFSKAQQHVGKELKGELLGGVAGYYVTENDSYYLRVDPEAWWKLFWPKEKRMNEAFKIIESEDRLTETTFAFGGNLILHWKMFEKVPFDPYITRGEDMDLLLNAKMFGFKFMLDTELRVLHLPSEGKRLWSEMRQDLYRFLYMRQKMLSQEHIEGVRHVSTDLLRPYPGCFLGLGAIFRFSSSSCLNSLHSFLDGDRQGSRESLRNIREISSALRLARKHCLSYFGFQKKWAAHVPKIRGDMHLLNVLQTSS